MGKKVVPLEAEEGASGTYYLYNHVKLIFSYHLVPDGARVVGFLVEPISVHHKFNAPWSESKGGKQIMTCYRGKPMPSLDSRRPRLELKEGKKTEVVWTYDVTWHKSDVKWASRWDVYLSMAGRYDDEIHWFSIFNALMSVMFLSGLIALILVRACVNVLPVVSGSERQQCSGSAVRARGGGGRGDREVSWRVTLVSRPQSVDRISPSLGKDYSAQLLRQRRGD